MRWINVSDRLRIRLVKEEPEFYSEEGLSLIEVLERVWVWASSDERRRADAWIEAAEVALYEIGERDLREAEAHVEELRSRHRDEAGSAINKWVAQRVEELKKGQLTESPEAVLKDRIEQARLSATHKRELDEALTLVEEIRKTYDFTSWVIISDRLHVRLTCGKPEFYAADGPSTIAEVFERVCAWASSHEDRRVNAWIEVVEARLKEVRKGQIREEARLERIRRRELAEAARAEKARRREVEKAAQAEAIRRRQHEEAVRLQEMRARKLGPAGISRFEYGERALKQGDYPFAMTLLLPLAESGDAEAQYYMGMIALEGIVSGPSHLQAYVWFEAAAQQGHAGARRASTQFSGWLTPEDLAEAAQRAAELKAKTTR